MLLIRCKKHNKSQVNILGICPDCFNAYKPLYKYQTKNADETERLIEARDKLDKEIKSHLKGR